MSYLDRIEAMDTSMLAEIGISIAIVLFAVLLGRIAKNIVVKVAEAANLDKFTKGTAIERFANSFDSSTIEITAAIIAWAIYLTGLIIALEFMDITIVEENITTKITAFLPNLIVAVLIIMFGVLIGDKADIYIRERINEVHLSGITVVGPIVKSTLIFLALLMALSQLGVSTMALNILLSAYLIGVVILAAIALRTILSSAVSGVYILTNEPYKIGDRVILGDIEGIVQEIDLLTTRIEDEEREYIVPNSDIFEKGISRELK